MDPKQWRTEHTSIQGITGPLDLLHPCDHLTKKQNKTVIICSAAEIRRATRTYSEKSAEYPGGHRTIENAPNNHVGDSAKQAGDQECVR